MLQINRTNRTPREAALIARGSDPEDPVILGWEMAFEKAVEPLQGDAGLSFLSHYILAPGDWTAVLAIRPSWQALRHLDRWFPCSFTEILKTASRVPEPVTGSAFANAFQGAVSKYPLLSLLSAQHPATDTGGVQVAKALLLAGLYRGGILPSAGVVGAYSDGLRKKLTRGDWHSLIKLETLSSTLDLPASIDQAEGILREALDGRSPELSPVKVEFLDSVSEILAALRSRGVGRSGRLPSVSIDLDSEERRPVGSIEVFLVEGGDVATGSTNADRPEPTERETAGEAPDVVRTSSPEPWLDQAGGETQENARQRSAITGFRSAASAQFLSIDHDQLLDHEVRALISALKDAFKGTREKERRVAALLTVCLFTGEKLEDLLESSIEPTVRSGFRLSGRWIRVIRQEPSARQPKPETRMLLAAHGDRLELALPLQVHKYFERILTGASAGLSLVQALGDSSDAIAKGVVDWLSDLRLKYPKILLGKVCRWLQTALYAKTFDDVAVHLLTSAESDPPCPGAYYYAPQASDLQRIHKALVSEIWRDEIHEPVVPATRVGSWWYPADSQLRRAYKATRKALMARSSNRKLSIPERHRAHQVLSVLNITFSLAIRPVSDPVESFDHFDLLRRIGMINDKGGGPLREHRIVPLPTVVVDQLKAQRSYLQSLMSEVRPLNLTTSLAIGAMLSNPESRVIPAFFLLEEDGSIRSITPKDIETEVGDIWPYPWNLWRHYLATALRERSVASRQVTSFLGHNPIGCQSLSALGPMSVQEHYAGMQQELERILRDIGLKAAAPFLERTAEGVAFASLFNPLGPQFEFGSAKRARERDARLNEIEDEIKQFLEKAAPPGGVESLSNDQIQKLFSELGRNTPNAHSYRATKLRMALRDHLAAIAKKTKKDWTLPATAVNLEDYRISVDQDALSDAPRVESLRSALRSNIEQLLGAKQNVPRGILALALATESLILDTEVLQDWICQRGEELIEVKRSGSSDQGSELWVSLPAGNAGQRQYPIQVWLAVAISSDKGGVTDRKSLATADREIAQFGKAHSISWLNGGLKGAVRRIRSAASLDISGLSLAFCDGSHGSVSLPIQAFERLVEGQIRDTTLAALNEKKAQKVDTLRPLEVAEDTASTAQSARPHLAAVKSFLDLVNQCFSQAKRFKEYKTDGMAHSATRVDYLEKTLRSEFDVLRATCDLPLICTHLSKWLQALCADGKQLTGKSVKKYALGTIQTYWSNVGRRLIEQLECEDISKMEPVEIEEIYTDILEYADTERLDHIYAALRVFHAYLMGRGVPGINWESLSKFADSGPGHVDANLLTVHEYKHALRLLLSDKSVDSRQRLVQSAVLILCFRCGLRIGEAIGLRRKDVICVGGVWIVRISRNLYRGLKSDNSIRVVPTLEKLDRTEHSTLERWLQHADEFSDGRSTTALFTKAPGERVIVPRSRIASKIRRALFEVTKDPEIRVHHCRHGLPNRVLAACLELHDKDNLHLQGLFDLWPSAADLLGVITQERKPTRRLIWGLAVLLGHSPSTLLRSYFHFGSELLRKELKKAWWRAESDIQTQDRSNLFTRSFEFKARESVVTRSDLQLFSIEDKALSADLVDRAIDVMRRTQRLDGVSDALLISEKQVQDIFEASIRFTVECGGSPSSMPAGWWILDERERYTLLQLKQVRETLERLTEKIDEAVSAALKRVPACIDVTQNLLVVDNDEDFRLFADLLSRFVQHPENIEMLLPAGTVKRLGTREREALAKSGMRVKRGRPTKGTSPLPVALDDAVWSPWVSLAKSRGFCVDTRSHLPGSRSGGRTRRDRQKRVCLRIRSNGTDRIRDGKVAIRVLSSLSVWRGLCG